MGCLLPLLRVVTMFLIGAATGYALTAVHLRLERIEARLIHMDAWKQHLVVEQQEEGVLFY